MRIIKNILTVILFSAGIVACGDNESLQSSGNYPQDGVVRIAPMAAEAFSRASAPYAGKTLGLCLEYGAGDKYSTDFVRWDNVDGKWEASKQMLWKSADAAAQVYAYAPFQGSTSDVENLLFAIQPDQTQGVDVADLVFGYIPDFVPSKGLDSDQALSLDLKHALVKLTLSLTYGDEFDGTGLTVEGVTLNQMASGVALNLTTGEVRAAAADAAQNIMMHVAGTNKYEAVFYPLVGQLPGKSMIDVTMSNKKIYQYTIPASGLSFEAGKAYDMQLKIGKDKLTISKDLSIKDWTSAPVLPGGEADLQ